MPGFPPRARNARSQGLPPSPIGRAANPAFSKVVEGLRRAGLNETEIEATLAKMPPVPMGTGAGPTSGSPLVSPLRNTTPGGGDGGAMAKRTDGASPMLADRRAAGSPLVDSGNIGDTPRFRQRVVGSSEPDVPVLTQNMADQILDPKKPFVDAETGVKFGGVDDTPDLIEAFTGAGGFNGLGKNILGAAGGDILLPAQNGGGFPTPAGNPLGPNASGHGAAAPGAGPPGAGGAPAAGGGFFDKILNPEVGRNLLDFGLATMTAADQSGASFLGAVGQGGQSALRGQDRRQLRDALTKRADRRDARDEERLDLERQRTAKKTPARVVNLRMPDGKRRSFRLDDPRLDRALNAGGTEVGTSGGSGDLSLAQERSNYEIDAAREILESQNISRDEIARRTAKATATGRENPDYDPTLDDLVRQAGQRKYGDDPAFSRTYRRLYDEPPPPIPELQGPGELESMGRGPGARARSADIETMQIDDLDDLINSSGDRLTPADLRRIERRLRQLGY